MPRSAIANCCFVKANSSGCIRRALSDGKPRYNSNGKVIKPENWVDPHNELKQEIERQTTAEQLNT
jgi:predicted HAD superfamily Cof-like phosphohydrolase